MLFGTLITAGQSTVAIGFFIGAAVMAVGGAAELLFGVHAERTPLENIAKPLTVVDAEAGHRHSTCPVGAAECESARTSK